MLYHLEEILSFNLIYRMLGIDSGITEKSGSKNSISEWRTFGMADRQNRGPRKFSEWRTFGIADLRSRLPSGYAFLPTVHCPNVDMTTLFCK